MYFCRSDGLQVGDYILSINAIKTASMRHDDVVTLMKNAGTRILLEIEYELPDHRKKLCYYYGYPIIE